MMNIKSHLCEAFCGALEVNKVPAGYAVSTGQIGPDGDPIGFYVVGPDDDGSYRIQDDGMYICAIESAGGDLQNKTRLATFNSLCDEYGVRREEDTGELVTAAVRSEAIGASALRFLAFLVRVQDLVWMSTERAVSTFRNDATKMLKEMIGDKARIVPDYVVSAGLQEVPADLGIIADGRPPVALFFGISDARLMEALLLQAWAQQRREDCAVIALLETEGAASTKMRQRANNHLTAVPNFRGEERAACARIAREALGFDPTLQ